LLGAENRQKIVKKNTRENSDFKLHMCLFAIKTKQFPKPQTKGGKFDHRQGAKVSVKPLKSPDMDGLNKT